MGCEMAQIGIASPEDIDLAMKLALNYPKGPLEWAAHLGPKTTLEIMTNLQPSRARTVIARPYGCAAAHTWG